MTTFLSSIIIISFSKTCFLNYGPQKMIYQMTKTRPFDMEEYLHLVQSFHGHAAPGVLVGGFMVHAARARIPEAVVFDAICETPVCLPDAIQLLTPCTVGNGWLKIINLGGFALSLYDKDQGDGFRVFLDPKKLDNWSEIKTWFFELKPKVRTKHRIAYGPDQGGRRDVMWDASNPSGT